MWRVCNVRKDAANGWSYYYSKTAEDILRAIWFCVVKGKRMGKEMLYEKEKRK